VLSNFRFKKQQICADEVGFYLGNTDVSVWHEGYLTEIEIKISKSDLRQGEKKKMEKHNLYRTLPPGSEKRYSIPHYYYFCVPSELVEEAKTEAGCLNGNYGVLEYRRQTGIWLKKPEDCIYIRKRAKPLHKELHPNGWNKIARRLASVNISLKENVQKLIRSNNEAYKMLHALEHGPKQLSIPGDVK
jgi:hypothetical protein